MRAKAEAIPGRLALSVAGRDQGRYFVILRVEEPYAWIADGAVRPAGRPKKKKLKHLRLTPLIVEEAAEGLERGRFRMTER